MINLVSKRYVSDNGSITTIIWNKTSGIIQVWYKYQIDDTETCINSCMQNHELLSLNYVTIIHSSKLTLNLSC